MKSIIDLYYKDVDWQCALLLIISCQDIVIVLLFSSQARFNSRFIKETTSLFVFLADIIKRCTPSMKYFVQ
jgi:hypothetical protein